MEGERGNAHYVYVAQAGLKFEILLPKSKNTQVNPAKEHAAQ